MNRISFRSGQKYNRPPRGPVRRFLRFSGFICVISATLLFGGFLWFADAVSALEPPSDPQADAIVVLTGGSQRINQGMELLQKGIGQRLLISGVHPFTSSTQIRKMTKAPAELFTCCVDIGYEALDTIGNARETANWVRDNGFKSVLVVTNNYHMTRSLAELEYADPQTQFIAYPVVNSNLKTRNWFSDRTVMRLMVAEYLKVIYTTVRNGFGLSSYDGLRSPRKTS